MAQLQYARLISKTGSGIATVPVSAFHDNNDWIDTDIYEGELYMDLDTQKVYTRFGENILEIGSGGAGDKSIYNADGTLTSNRTVSLKGKSLKIQMDGSTDDEALLFAKGSSTFSLTSTEQAVGNAVPSFVTGNGSVVRLFDSGVVTLPTGGSVVDAECRRALTAILTKLNDLGLMSGVEN